MIDYPPQLSEEVRRRLRGLAVNPADVEERFVRGTGPGGQKINKTSSTVSLRHRPSGLVIRCQGGRSQAANREWAWAELAARLERRVREAAGAARAAHELERRRTRQKTRGQKERMIAAKKHRARVKQARRGGWED